MLPENRDYILFTTIYLAFHGGVRLDLEFFNSKCFHSTATLSLLFTSAAYSSQGNVG